MEAGEVAQLIKVRSYRYANVTAAGLEAAPWDPATGTGGVVALFVHGVLRLDGDIDVTVMVLKGLREAPMFSIQQAAHPRIPWTFMSLSTWMESYRPG